MSERSRRFLENWIARSKRLRKKKIFSQSKDSRKSQAQSTEATDEKPKDEITEIKDSIECFPEALDEDDTDGCIAAEEIDSNTEQICNILERLEKVEKTSVDIQEGLGNEEKKRERLGCAVIICVGILLFLILCGIKAFWLAGVVFCVTLVGVSLYATR